MKIQRNIIYFVGFFFVLCYNRKYVYSCKDGIKCIVIIWNSGCCFSSFTASVDGYGSAVMSPFANENG